MACSREIMAAHTCNDLILKGLEIEGEMEITHSPVHFRALLCETISSLRHLLKAEGGSEIKESLSLLVDLLNENEKLIRQLDSYIGLVQKV